MAKKLSVAESVARSVARLPERMIASRENRKGVNRNGARKGKHTTEKVGFYVHKMLAANEVKPQHERWSDTAMKEAMMEEFAGFPDTMRFLTKGRPNPIAYYRHRYNLGKLSPKLSPPILSVRYDIYGDAILPKHTADNPKYMTKSDYILQLYSYGMNVILDKDKREYVVLDYDFFNRELYESLPTDV